MNEEMNALKKNEIECLIPRMFSLLLENGCTSSRRKFRIVSLIIIEPNFTRKASL